MLRVMYRFRKVLNKLTSNITRKDENSEQYMYIDEYRRISKGKDAKKLLSSRKDNIYLGKNGIAEINLDRWAEAQRYEERSWMSKSGLSICEDRNSQHKKNFDSYSFIKDKEFNNAIEIGCGPFTNIRDIYKYCNISNITLLDPLINRYIHHPHCAYSKQYIYNTRVKLDDRPIEQFSLRHDEPKFDLVIVINVLEHCYSFDKFCERILSILANKGIFIFNDKLLSLSQIQHYSQNLFDSGHPLRVADERILDFLKNNFQSIYENFNSVDTPVGEINTIYFAGMLKS